ncbi:Fe(2+) transporter permease subunit FeoB [Thiomicrorhabdus sp. zzn3]|uniref:Fe(2+) transporter permease subunit FeoB n=1 Tax=Thiomicrorhabdus sp. zzn3 TaxID=3039775 RepID=UPI00243686BD|nr:Fe(2+) transporter permease subunit FeoB [Thiomicrorhabdus sp. zzn3]MDG6777192.1 Fe(2+) transporter permease subunit FeoB [Thiomicrorhabdus sp. zzn3]
MTVVKPKIKFKKHGFPSKHAYQVALIGSPNCGKTTLFNRLTGSQQTTGNWPGVTVEQKSGYIDIADMHYHLMDLPGVYSLESSSHTGLDEKVALDYLQCQPTDLILNIVDATSLERQLFLTAQLLHMGLPVVVVLNRMDLLKERHLQIDIEALSKSLGCPVIPVSAYFNQGIDELKQQLPNLVNRKSDLHFDLPETLHASVHAVRDLQAQADSDSCWKTLQMLIKPELAPLELRSFCAAEKTKLEAHYQEDLALISADLYFQFAHEAAHSSLIHTDRFTRNTTDTLDRWALHPIWGLPIFLLVMYMVFALSITIGNTFLDFFDLGAQALFVDGPTELLQAINAPDWLIAILAQGIGSGIQVVATFIPVIGALFLLLSILEESGYMQRAAFIMDGLMRKLGLSGQAFIPLVVGFGCNIPAVLASRTLPDQRDRIMTIMMTPFMSCSARLTVYVMFATAFFADYGALLVFSLYVVGILAAVLTALLLKYTLLPGTAPALLMELPIYHKPAIINVLLNTRNRLKSFILDAGKVIVLVVLGLNLLSSLGTDGSFGHENQNDSVLSTVAKTATPIFEPLGVNEENWPATVGLITGLLAKEVVVGSLDALYQNMDNTAPINKEEPYDFIGALQEAVMTIPANLPGIVTDVDDPLGLQSIENIADKKAIAEEQGFTLSTLDKMVNYFDGKVGAYAYLLLVLLYFPCVATFGAIKQELGWRWALYSGGWSLFLGYSTAVAFYQISTFSSHPQSSSLWLSAIALGFITIALLLHRTGRAYRQKSPRTLP